MRLRTLGLVVTVALNLAVAFAAEREPAGKVRRIGILLPGTLSTNAHLVEALRQGLKELGYIEGRNFLLEPRYAVGEGGRCAEYAKELTRLNVDVIVAAGPMIQAAGDATRTIPIVMSAASDPVALGFVGIACQRSTSSRNS